jgi:hypothetical protein
MGQRDYYSIEPKEAADDKFNEEELDAIVRTLNNNKAPGPDQIKGNIVKLAHSWAGPAVLKIYNACWKLGNFPQTCLSCAVEPFRRVFSDLCVRFQLSVLSAEVSMPTRNSVRGRKGKEPPEKPPASKVPSRATPPPETTTTPAIMPSTRHQVYDPGQKNPSKTDQNKPPACHPPMPRASPSTSRASSPAASHVSSPAPSSEIFSPLFPINQKAFYNLSVATLGLKSVQLRVNYNKTALVISNAPIVPNFIKTLQVAANSPTITIDPINKTKIPVPRLPSKNPPSRWSSATSPKTSPPRRSQPSALHCR